MIIIHWHASRIDKCNSFQLTRQLYAGSIKLFDYSRNWRRSEILGGEGEQNFVQRSTSKGGSNALIGQNIGTEHVPVAFFDTRVSSLSESKRAQVTRRVSTFLRESESRPIPPRGARERAETKATRCKIIVQGGRKSRKGEHLSASPAELL